jgi:hypothetical protein
MTDPLAWLPVGIPSAELGESFLLSGTLRSRHHFKFGHLASNPLGSGSVGVLASLF